MTRFTPIYLFIYFWLKQWACLVTIECGKSEKQEIFCGRCDIYIPLLWITLTSIIPSLIGLLWLPVPALSDLWTESWVWWLLERTAMCIPCLSHQLAYFSYSVLFFSILSSDFCASISIPLVQILSPLTKLFCWIHLSRRRQAVGLRSWSGRFLLVKF